jgi:hypothetical protein
VNSIYRKSLKVEDYQKVPLTGPPISVAADRGGYDDVFDLWYEHMDGNDEKLYGIYVLGTGHPVPWSNLAERRIFQHLGTVITPSGYLVWHVYQGIQT